MLSVSNSDYSDQRFIFSSLLFEMFVFWFLAANRDFVANIPTIFHNKDCLKSWEKIACI